MPAVDLEQVRAQRAFAAAAGLDQSKQGEDFLRVARKLPVTLRTNGLLAGLAFLRAKQESEPLRSALEGHLQQQFDQVFAKVLALFGSGSGDTLTGRELQTLTAEAIVFSGWLKRAAEAICARGDDKAGAAAP